MARGNGGGGQNQQGRKPCSFFLEAKSCRNGDSCS
jgi:hypothetical protein